jgi:hypothetical protein
MQKIRLLILTLMYCTTACHEAPSKQDPPAKDEKKNFFPVADYMRSEISAVDSLPLAIYRYRIHGGKTDSSLIRQDEFDRLAGEFLPKELDSARFAQDFTESSFIDQTTNAVTLTYAAKSDESPLGRVDILAANDPALNHIKSVYMEKREVQGDTTLVKKMYWKAGRFFQITTVSQVADQPSSTSQLKVVWDNRE